MTLITTGQTSLCSALILCAGLSPLACVGGASPSTSTAAETAETSTTNAESATKGSTTSTDTTTGSDTSGEGSGEASSSSDSEGSGSDTGTDTGDTSSTDTGDPPPDGYGQCLSVGQCFIDECAFNGSVNTCCQPDSSTCAPICDGIIELCPPAPGFEVGCNPFGGFGDWNGHCYVKCNEGGVCPEGMMCKELNFGPFCAWK